MSPGDLNEITVFDDAVDNMDIIKSVIATKNQEDGFYIVDIGDIINKHREWITKIPRVAPHYGTSALNTFLDNVAQICIERIEISHFSLNWFQRLNAILIRM